MCWSAEVSFTFAGGEFLCLLYFFANWETYNHVKYSMPLLFSIIMVEFGEGLIWLSHPPDTMPPPAPKLLVLAHP